MTVKRITDSDFEELTGYSLSNVSFLKLFPVLQDTEDNEYFIDIFRSYTVRENVFNDGLYFSTYECKNEDWWDSIAYQEYENAQLWWLICLTNSIVNPFEEIEPGKNISLLRRNYVSQIVKEIRAMGDL